MRTKRKLMMINSKKLKKRESKIDAATRAMEATDSTHRTRCAATARASSASPMTEV